MAPQNPLNVNPLNAPDLLRKAARSTSSRRAQYSASTQRALVDVARDLFSRNGYAGTSLDEIVGGARVTKGALYHHFSGKQALFEAVFERVEEDAAKRIRKAIKKSKDPWDQVNAGVRAFFEVARGSEYRRIVVQEGPSVLGYERFREQEERTTLSIVQDMVSVVVPQEVFPKALNETLARLFFGALSAAGTQLSTSEDPDQASNELETVIAFLLTGIREQFAAATTASKAATSE
ncbi:MAG TPA: TetR/AcrR family transcriptional regulator [Nocardioidaceae bacterium]|nr:TetR/AcrR family transcriptional regulator [Nocardioidaceae bacterium]